MDTTLTDFIRDMHYIPANNVMAFYLVGGDASARAEVLAAAQRMRAGSSLDTNISRADMQAWIDWYEKTCMALLDGLKQGGRVHTDYPAFVPA